MTDLTEKRRGWMGVFRVITTSPAYIKKKKKKLKKKKKNKGKEETNMRI